MEQDELNWKTLWHGKKSKPFDTQKFVDQVVAIEKRAKIDRMKFIILIPIIIISLSSLFPIFNNSYYFISISLIFLGMLMIFLQNLKNKPSLLLVDADYSNKKFIENQILKLKGRLKTASIYLWISGVFLVVGFNLMCLEALQEMHLVLRIVIHFLYFILLPFLLKQRMLSYNKEILPLIERLELINLN